MSCGPPKMVDEIRKLVGQTFEKSYQRVDLFEELQSSQLPDLLKIRDDCSELRTAL
ncbi:uncharacterized protein CYBJADRAFT_175932 [Cyberlindnera jadinii NRRL Y-1542]|uniref:Uncharacterized protein n=1 Tax=Cyberlindnera jadinii (strain ATCC 18201 / CBS 1600 / BCRC 20928 / JCM 3617 / NBRC 0987 / NRRL Y-1542) TaxID=983966 RepID=A0A1E4RTJ6_CYBJN|nr:hypothetical protein CYBJADRAFT_175932 [Cyberlindnera jadinii NRRL Y-1542]ODV70593.1 hypothetical protein CYBJADRAFT_175932 [Cyberlindnera jadinii NRRL Y-1542]